MWQAYAWPEDDTAGSRLVVRSEPSCDAPNQSVCLPDLEVVLAYDKLVPAYDKLKPALPVMLPVPEMKSMHVPGRSPVVPRSG